MALRMTVYASYRNSSRHLNHKKTNLRYVCHPKKWVKSQPYLQKLFAFYLDPIVGVGDF